MRKVTMKKRIEKKLTSKQANGISLLVSAICTILLAIMCVTSYSDWDAMQCLVLVLCCIMLPILIYFLCYEIILKGDQIKLAEENTELHKSTKEFLCKEEFTEVSFDPKKDNGESEREMLLTIIKTIECRFFAKLNENDDIILIVKNQEDNDIYRCEISNYSYFNARFKPKSN